LASDVARPAPLVTELAEARRERDELDRIRRDASDGLRLLERERPAWYRSRARVEHVGAIERTTATVKHIDRALLKLDARENQVLEQLARERAARQPERPAEPAVRMCERGRGIGRGL